MRRAIVVPDLGVGAPVVSAWYVRLGEQVYTGDRIVELLLGSATFEVAAPCAGRLVEKHAWPDDAVGPAAVLGYIEEAPDA